MNLTKPTTTKDFISEHPCRVMTNAEGSLQNPQIEDEETLKNLAPVELIRFDLVDADYQGRSYKKTVALFYSFASQKFYSVALKSKVKAMFKACIEINPEQRTFTVERDSDKNLMWVKALSK